MKSKFSFLCVLTLLIGSSAPAQSPPSISSVLDAQRQVKSYSSAVISPDGTRVTWVEGLEDRGGSSTRLSAVWTAPAAGGKPVRVTAAADGKNHRELGPAWSPDGQRLAFLSDAARERQLEIYVASPTGAPVRQITRVIGQLSHLDWSPDGKSIAFLFVEGSAQEPGALVPYKLDSGVVEETFEEQRIAVVDLASGRVRTISPPDLYIYEYDWSPKGDHFAATGAHGSGTNNYWVAQLYTIRADSGEARSIWKPPLQIASPRWSPDGGEIAFIPSEEILFTEQLDGGSGIARLHPQSGRVETIWSGPESLHLTVARSGAASAGVRSSFEGVPEVWAGEIGKWRAITHGNENAKRFWGEARNLHWESGGTRAQGWLLYPMGFDSSKKYPMVVSVHGGPAAAVSASWPSRWNAVLPSQGYFVFLPNPRGSYGFGEKFTQGNVKDFGYGDLQDILAGVDEAVKQAPIDKNRLGIVGWSYGGYMTMWAVTQTGRFQAAVAGAGIVNWQSYYGQNRIDQWLVPYFGKPVYEDPEVYARSSPITFIKNVKTPSSCSTATATPRCRRRRATSSGTH